MKSVVDVKNIQKMYGKKGRNQSHVLTNVSFFIQEGEFELLTSSPAVKNQLFNTLTFTVTITSHVPSGSPGPTGPAGTQGVQGPAGIPGVKGVIKERKGRKDCRGRRGMYL